MEFEAHEYWIGSHFLSALINGDVTGLSDEEFPPFDRWETGVRVAAGGLGHWATVNDETDEFGQCDVTGLRGPVSKVAYMAPTGD